MKKIIYFFIPFFVTFLTANNNNYDTKLTKEELVFLKNNKILKVCIDPNWMPFEKNLNGKHIGMTADYLKLIENKLQIKMEMIPTKTWIESLNFGKEKM